jgi:hypothetical protein
MGRKGWPCRQCSVRGRRARVITGPGQQARGTMLLGSVPMLPRTRGPRPKPGPPGKAPSRPPGPSGQHPCTPLPSRPAQSSRRWHSLGPGLSERFEMLDIPRHQLVRKGSYGFREVLIERGENGARRVDSPKCSFRMGLVMVRVTSRAGRADRAARLNLGRTSSPLGLCRPSARTDSTTSEKTLTSMSQRSPANPASPPNIGNRP